MKEAEMSTNIFSLNMSDDEPLSMWFKALKTAHATSNLVYINVSFHTCKGIIFYTTYIFAEGRNVEQQSTTNCSQDFVIRSSQSVKTGKTADTISKLVS